MPLGQRVVLIGGGHNGLIAAFYLARGGFKPLVLERRETVGGGAITEEFYPGFRASVLAHTVGPLRADIGRDMQLDRFSCEILSPDPRVFAPTPEGKALFFYNDTARTAEGIAHFSEKDAAKYAEFAESLVAFFQNELVAAPTDRDVTAELVSYLRATGAWTASDAQLQAKAPGLAHLIAGSAEYQFV